MPRGASQTAPAHGRSARARWHGRFSTARARLRAARLQQPVATGQVRGEPPLTITTVAPTLRVGPAPVDGDAGLGRPSWKRRWGLPRRNRGTDGWGLPRRNRGTDGRGLPRRSRECGGGGPLNVAPYGFAGSVAARAATSALRSSAPFALRREASEPIERARQHKLRRAQSGDEVPAP